MKRPPASTHPPSRATLRWTVFGLLGWVAMSACASERLSTDSRRAAFTKAIRSVVTQDSELGGVRNHAPESGPLAEAVRDYVRGLDAIDFGDCPADFTAAFERHRDAWRNSVAYLEEHDSLRGEMHELFDAIRALGGTAREQIEAIERDIWSTWADVEAAVERHRAGGAYGEEAQRSPRRRDQARR